MVSESGSQSLADLLQRYASKTGDNEEQAPVFKPSFMKCAKGHPDFPISFKDDRGIVRYHPAHCPVCRRETDALSLSGEDAAKNLRFARCSFENFEAVTPDQKKVLEACRSYASGFSTRMSRGDGFLMLGNPGTGKNHLAWAICREISRAGQVGIVMTALDIADRVKSSWNNPSEKQEQVLASFAGLDLLVIDEVGRQWGSKVESEILFRIINTRYTQMRPTALISNFEEDAIRSYLSDAGFERILDGAIKMSLRWKSHRAEAGIVGSGNATNKFQAKKPGLTSFPLHPEENSN